mmetsp:Transcript_55309/g.117618  ORF Transcript_55309/g.117618 Transcript_55309/m.117618 type:complete len:88 (-) Transcript_55309:50-313(-)
MPHSNSYFSLKNYTQPVHIVAAPAAKIQWAVKSNEAAKSSKPCCRSSPPTTPAGLIHPDEGNSTPKPRSSHFYFRPSPTSPKSIWPL